MPASQLNHELHEFHEPSGFVQFVKFVVEQEVA
ncbi:MAG: hypothetical protein QOG31_1594 [Thermoplasmata archaeon]|jgi:hypothetical protein|nr:hypothetical protein [Thermoplasmata archaeon]